MIVDNKTLSYASWDKPRGIFKDGSVKRNRMTAPLS